MAVTPTFTAYVVLDLIAWQADGSLVLSPKFQRRPVWKPSSRSYFIDTILRGYPVPPIHVRLGMGASRRAEREVIDGQQRLHAVLDFVRGRYRLSRTLSAPWAGKSFEALSREERDSLLLYKFQGFQYEGLSDALVLEIFARMNTYSVQLNAQELRNGRYFGTFRDLVYDISRQHLEFWRSSRIFTEGSIARMQEVQLVSEFAVLLMDGLQDKKATLDQFYSKLDADWSASSPETWRARDRQVPRQLLPPAEVRTRINRTLNTISEAVGDMLPETEFRRVPLFYTLFAVMAHRLFGVPGVEAPTPLRPLDSESVLTLRDVMVECSYLVAERPGDEDLVASWHADFLLASLRQTDNIGPRRTRFNLLWERAYLGEE